MHHRKLGATTLAVLAMAIAFAACGSSGNESASNGAGENTFGLGEFTITPPTNALHAGSISLTADNMGGEVHELVIVRADDIASLPTKPDGSVDEDKIPASDVVGEIEDIAAQSQKSKVFDLTAGNYVALCNLVDSMMGSGTTMMGGGSGMMHDGSDGHGTAGTGHVHFAEGMSVAFSVS